MTKKMRLWSSNINNKPIITQDNPSVQRIVINGARPLTKS